MAKAMQEDVKLGWEWDRIEAGITIGRLAMCGWWTGGRVNGWIDDGEPHHWGGYVWVQGALAAESPATSKAIQSPGSNKLAGTTDAAR